MWTVNFKMNDKIILTVVNIPAKDSPEAFQKVMFIPYFSGLDYNDWEVFKDANRAEELERADSDT